MGFLIAIEGIDGAGKTTVAEYVRKVLSDFGFKAEVLKEPGDSEYGRILKEANKRLPPEKELELFILDRIEDVNKNILPRVNSCMSVIMDRYYYSNVAYQGASGLNPDEILKKNEEIAPRPDLTILLDLEPEIAFERLRARGKLSPFEDIDYLRKVREIYLGIKSPEIKIVDAGRPLEHVLKDVYEIVMDLLSSRGSFFEMALRK